LSPFFAQQWRSRKSNQKQWTCCPGSPQMLNPWTCCQHEKKARDDFSAIAVPSNQQRPRREPDCEMLRESLLLCSRNGERLLQRTKRAGDFFALRYEHVILSTRKDIYMYFLGLTPRKCYLYCLLLFGNAGPTARHARITLLKSQGVLGVLRSLSIQALVR